MRRQKRNPHGKTYPLGEVEEFVDSLRARKERARDAAAQRLRDAFKKLDTLDQAPPTAEEVQAEIDAARAERRARHADRR